MLLPGRRPHCDLRNDLRRGLPRQADRGRGQHELPDDNRDGHLQRRTRCTARKYLHQRIKNQVIKKNLLQVLKTAFKFTFFFFNDLYLSDFICVKDIVQEVTIVVRLHFYEVFKNTDLNDRYIFRFLILPDMLKNAPMFKNMNNKNRGGGGGAAAAAALAGGAGRGKSAILRAQAARGRGRAVPGVIPRGGGRGGGW